MTVRHSSPRTAQQYIWLIGGILFLVASFVFWILTDSKELVAQSKQIEETQVQIQPEKVAATNYLGGLTDQVRPLELTARKVASGNHLPEFRGTKFIQDNKNNYFIELFRVTNEDVIKSFLNKQTDRKPYIYFRLSGEDQIEQYILGYGLFMGEGAAKTTLNGLDLKLPPSVAPKVTGFNQFVGQVNDMGSEELTTAKLYEIKLRPAAVPLIDESLLVRPKPTPVVDPAKATTNVTITRKDQSGNVVDVRRSQSNVDPISSDNSKNNTDKRNQEAQISDPFN